MPTKEAVAEVYDSSSIKILEGLEAVRLRPAMYIGSTGEAGLHHLVYEVVDNSVDEHLAGYCDRIDVNIHIDDSITIVDNGRGIPVKMHESGVSAAEVVLTKLHAGGKFDSSTYKVSGGLHGVGVSCVNALSESFEVEIWREKQTWEQEYSRGIPKAPLGPTGKAGNKTGTKITFKPDPTIMDATKFNFDTLAQRLRELAFLNKGLTITLTDEREENKSHTFHYSGGIAEFIRHLNKGKNVLHEKPIWFEADREMPNGGTLSMEVALQYNDGYSETLFSFANNINTVDGGTHLSGFRSALTRTINQAGQQAGLFKDQKENLSGDDVREGLTAVISVKLPQPQFEGQTKGKLADCQEKDPERCELYLVEGESAGGTAKSGRDRRFQAILPLKGKILNVEKARYDKMLGHEEIRAMITAIGTGIGKDDFNVARLRYSKIIIMTDADVDGSHIRTLLLTFFFRHMQELITRGNVYVAQPPLYRIKKGKSEKYIKDDKEFTNEILRRATENVSLEYGTGENLVRLEKGELKAFLMSLDDFAQVFRQAERRLRDARVVEILANPELHIDSKADFGEKANVQPVFNALKAQKLETELIYDETHSSWTVTYHDPTNAVRVIGVELAQQPEFRRLRAVAKQIQRHNHPPFTVVKDTNREVLTTWRDLLNHVKGEGMRDAQVQRYKGLGEMNAEQLWETTMNPEKRTLLQVRLEDMVECEEIFSTLMGENVESRRKFIEDNALDVRNLDV